MVSHILRIMGTFPALLSSIDDSGRVKHMHFFCLNEQDLKVITFGWIIAVIISQTTELIAKIHTFDNSLKGKH